MPVPVLAGRRRDSRVRAALRGLLNSEPGLTCCGEAREAAAIGQLAAERPGCTSHRPAAAPAAEGTQVLCAAAAARIGVVVLPPAERSVRCFASALPQCWVNTAASGR